jgi:HSP20 family protein
MEALMAIQRWDPARDLKSLQQKMNRLFDEAFSRTVGPEGVDTTAVDGWKPSTDLIEDDERYILRADLPGVPVNEVDIRVENGMLLLRGERKMDSGIALESYLRVERPYGRFSLQVSLAPSVDPKAIRATHRNGVIEILLPKKTSEAPSKIEVSAT